MKKTFLILLFLNFFLSLVACEKKNQSIDSQATHPKIHFFAFGDWGSGTQDQKEVANETRKVCQEFGCDFGLLLGDNFYPFGVNSTEDPFWQSRYKEVYHGIDIPFYVALGNHDWRGNPQAQIDYSKMDSRWKMPAFFYSIKYPEQNPILEIFVLNSNDFNLDSQNWLKTTLAASTAKWKMLAFHHPILNVGDKHPPDQMHLWPALKSIACNKIDLILSGHEHIFAHLRPQSNECQYDQMIIGTGGKELYGVKTTPSNIRMLNADASFGTAWFEVTEKNVRLKFFRANGENPYSYTWAK